MTLGSPIEKGHGLYPELQKLYIRKGSLSDTTAAAHIEALEVSKDHDGFSVGGPYVDADGYNVLTLQ
jgi:uncharacterized protein YciI